MGIFKRIANVFKGFFSLFISDIEKEHPEIAYENSINSMIEKYTRLKSATAAIISRRDIIENRLREARVDGIQVAMDLNTVIDSEEDDLALVLLQRQTILQETVTELETDAEIARTDAEKAKSSLLNVQTEINKLKAEKDWMLAKMHSAQARIKIQEQLDGLSVDAEVKALDNVRQRIQDLQAEAGMHNEIVNESLDGKLQKIRQKGKTDKATKQLAELKARRQAAKAASSSKTM